MTNRFLVGYLLAIRQIFLQQWRTNVRGGADALAIISLVPTVAVLAWIGAQSGRNAVTSYLVIGLFFMVLWYESMRGPRWAIMEEVWQGTLESSVVSRTPFILLVFAKTLAHTVAGVRPGLVSLVTAMVVVREGLTVANTAGLILAIGAVIVGVTITSLALAPLTVLALGGVTATRTIMVVLSGFLYPVAFLPPVLHVPSRLIPTSWAMDGAYAAIVGGSLVEILPSLGISLALSAGYLMLSGALFGVIEGRLRRTGGLVTPRGY
jgi:hypothetical protein